MILQALCQLAEREHLIGDPDFEYKPVRWIVKLGPGGAFRGFTDTNTTPPLEETGKKIKKPKPVAKSLLVPRDAGMNTRTSGSYAGPLFDKADYVFGVVTDENERNEKTVKRAAERGQLFCERVRRVYDATKDEGVAAVLAFLDAIASGAAPALPGDCGPGDLFAFIYEPDVDRLVTSRPAVQAWWKKERSAEGIGGREEMQCLVTGKPISTTDLFPKIKRVPGVQGDISLVSFNSRAFESYGLKSNDNAPVSREAAEAVSTALNRLLHPAFPDPDRPGETLRPRSRRLSDDTALCYWSASSNTGFEDNLGFLFEADPTQVDELYKCIWSGRTPDDGLDMSPFYGLVITGTQGRAILRDWFEVTLGKAQVAIVQHFDDLRIVRNAPWKKGEEAPPAIPLRMMLEGLAEQGKQDNIPSALAAQFVRAALTGTPYPFGLLTRAVERSRAEIGNDDWAALQRRDARAAIIKAVLNRLHRRDHRNDSNQPQEREVTEAMDPLNTNPGYVLGCLMAVLERLQQEALGDVNASVVDKYFGSASAAPRATFDRLVRNARHHARKAADGERAGFVFRLERLIDALLTRINVNDRDDVKSGRPIGFPLTLPLEQQGLFVIGYHHMRHWLFLSREERDAWEAQHPSAPRAMLWNSRTDRPAATTSANQ